MTIGAHEIPAGKAVAASISLIHMDQELYPEPQRFNPDRFLDWRPKPHEFLPFGGGHRRCIGAAFASMELRIALATLVRDFEVELLEKRPPASKRRNITMAAASGVPVKLSPRGS